MVARWSATALVLSLATACGGGPSAAQTAAALARVEGKSRCTLELDITGMT